MPLPRVVRGVQLLVVAVVMVVVVVVVVGLVPFSLSLLSGSRGRARAAPRGALTNLEPEALERLPQEVRCRVGAAQEGARLGYDGGEAGRGRGGGGGRRGKGGSSRPVGFSKGGGDEGRIVPFVLLLARCASGPVAACWN